MQIDAVEVYGKDTQSYTSLEHVNIHKKLDESLPNAKFRSSLVDKPPKHQKKQWKSMKWLTCIDSCVDKITSSTVMPVKLLQALCHLIMM